MLAGLIDSADFSLKDRAKETFVDSERMLECEQIACLTRIGTLSALVRAVGISYITYRPIRVN